ncbi:diguanylate cyclase (GGDEF)-like protein [Kineococcus xinjiangensis]|uniref:Diguanylate cyclase (GGDEF)-like protein n=1 Tax=Kineococcus xinjiangensis TaxID=512762 RepID=A0A2S6IVP3_9ACTN|nr:diguanylate cyclase [Kineococcus xinjiangensis]PPK98393.1 diguanylate cyclase (GGDEF)-like protein [Kineococcus xinjiangensis]
MSAPAEIPSAGIVVFLLAALLCGATAGWSWRHRRITPAATALAALMAGAGGWAACAGLLHLGVPVLAERVVHVVNYAAIHLLIASTLCMTWAVVDPSWRLRRRTLAVLALVPAVVVLVVATDAWHHLFYSGYEDTAGYPKLVFGPAFWAHSAYCYALLTWSMARLVRGWWRASSIFRKQLGSLIAGALLPTALNAVTLSAPQVFSGVDYTPVFFVLTGLIMARALFRQGLLQVVPVARAQVVDTLQDGVFVVDHAGRVVDVNRAGQTMIRRIRPDLPAELVGLPAREVLRRPEVRPLLEETCQRIVEVAPGLHLDLRSSVHVDARGNLLARVVTARDVSEAVAADRALREHVATIEELREQLQEEAVRDALTGLHNRRHLMASLDRALADAAATGEPVGLVLMDVDHFKSVNDTHGHQVGDDVLCAVAHSLLAGTREGDTVARYGGEEFVVLLPGAGVEATMRRAEQIRTRCEATVVPLVGADGPRSLSVTISAGVAVHPADGADARALVAAADAALYAAKAGGRNRVVLAR